MEGIVFQQVEILEPEWTPYEVAMWFAGLVPIVELSKAELLEKFPPSKDLSI